MSYRKDFDKYLGLWHEYLDTGSSHNYYDGLGVGPDLQDSERPTRRKEMINMDRGDNVSITRATGGLIVSFVDSQNSYITPETVFIGENALGDLSWYDLSDRIDDMIEMIKGGDNGNR